MLKARQHSQCKLAILCTHKAIQSGKFFSADPLIFLQVLLLPILCFSLAFWFHSLSLFPIFFAVEAYLLSQADVHVGLTPTFYSEVLPLQNSMQQAAWKREYRKKERRRLQLETYLLFVHNASKTQTAKITQTMISQLKFQAEHSESITTVEAIFSILNQAEHRHNKD